MNYLDKSDHWRLHYHIMPEKGWLNDPNGAIQFKGQYHIYYQYVPETPLGGATHWGHMTSPDLVHFKQEEIFMSPDQPFDRHGVYSGGGFVKDGLIHFFYTGNVKKDGDYDYIYKGREQNVVHVVSDDGFNILKREVVIPHEEFEDGYTDHIRDPKILEHDGVYYMVLGARTIDNVGAVLTYRSTDLENWTYARKLIEGTKEEGYMWECPDLFKLDDKYVLIFSPQGIREEKYQFNNPHVAGYMIGQMDWDEVKFIPETEFVELDRGFDFYAPHTFEDEEGRRIMWSWMGVGDTMPEYTNPTIARGWQHALAMPRLLTIKNNRLIQQPLKAYNTLRKDKQVLNINENYTLDDRAFELLVELPTEDEFSIEMIEDTVLDYKDGILTLEHGPSGYGRRWRSTEVDHINNVHIYVDTSSIEVFVNDGEVALASRVYPKGKKPYIHVKADDQTKVTLWGLKSSL